MTVEPKQLKDLQAREEKLVQRMYKYKTLYLKNKVLDRMYDNYQQALKYGIEYLKQKPTLQIRDVNIIDEILNK